MAKRKRRRNVVKNRPRSWLSVISVLLVLAGAYVAMREDRAAESGESPAAVFAVWARLDVDLDEVRRMRASPQPPRAKPAEAPWRRVAEVLDGDTVRLDNGETVRLLGVDAPESSVNRKLQTDAGRMRIRVSDRELLFLGQEAVRFAAGLARGKRCWLEYDRSETDQYDRTLCYLHLEDGVILNEAMLAQGYARAYLSQPFLYKRRYILLQLDARAKRLGLWGL